MGISIVLNDEYTFIYSLKNKIPIRSSLLYLLKRAYVVNYIELLGWIR